MSEKRGCFKTGCLGCLGTGGAGLLILVILLVLGFLTGGSEDRMVPLDRAQQVPLATPPRPADSEAPAPAEDTELPEKLLDREIDVAEPGRVVLDLNRGRFEIVPGPPEGGIRVEGRYNEGRFELEERFESYGETGWIYRLGFDEIGIGLRPFVETDENQNRVRLVLPRDVPISLEGRVGIGESELRLGGLWLVDVDLRIGIGEHTVSFDQPLPVPVGRLKLDTSIGVLNVDEVGNASPKDVWIKHSVGETRIDLDGAWRRDAEALISCGVGLCDVRLPRDVHIDLESARVTIGESTRRRPHSAPEDAPTLKLSVSGSIGEVHVR